MTAEIRKNAARAIKRVKDPVARKLAMRHSAIIIVVFFILVVFIKGEPVTSSPTLSDTLCRWQPTQ